MGSAQQRTQERRGGRSDGHTYGGGSDTLPFTKKGSKQGAGAGGERWREGVLCQADAHEAGRRESHAQAEGR